MRKIVIDLEWNQPLKGRTHVDGLPGEVIQIGAAVMNDDGTVGERFNQMIKPHYYSRMNKDISALTLITDADIAKGIPLKDAVEKFRSFCGEDFVFLEWGPEDIRMLERNMIKFGLDTGWLPRAYDAQLMFDDMEMQEDRCWPLNYALFHYSEKPDGAHDALADAVSTILILRHLDLEDGLSDDYFRCDHLPDLYEEDETDSPEDQGTA